MADASIIMDLLSKLASDHQEIKWRMRCTYADGLGKSYHEIQLFREHDRKKKTILFEMATGQVLPYGCSGVSTNGSDNIIDLLLDLINYENAIS
jgi:ABC-type uncharacterized transport system ATPase subunit